MSGARASLVSSTLGFFERSLRKKTMKVMVDVWDLKVVQAIIRYHQPNSKDYQKPLGHQLGYGLVRSFFRSGPGPAPRL